MDAGLDMPTRTIEHDRHDEEPRRSRHKFVGKVLVPRDVPPPLVLPRVPPNERGRRTIIEPATGRSWMSKDAATRELGISMDTLDAKLAALELHSVRNALEILDDEEARFAAGWRAAESAGLSLRQFKYWHRRGIEFSHLSTRTLRRVAKQIRGRDAKKRAGRP